MNSIQCVCNFCPHAAALLIKGPTKPILEGQQFAVECLYSDPEVNISQVHLEMFSKVVFIVGTNFTSYVNAPNEIFASLVMYTANLKTVYWPCSCIFFPSVHEKMASLLSATLVPWLWSRNPEDSAQLGDVHLSCKQRIWWFLSLRVSCQKCNCTRQLLPGSGHQSPVWVTLTLKDVCSYVKLDFSPANYPEFWAWASFHQPLF